jgi:hypothetical protein
MKDRETIETTRNNLSGIIDQAINAGFPETFVINPIVGAMFYRDALAWVLDHKEGASLDSLLEHIEKCFAPEFPEFIDE